jgi:hypothetical protein
MPNISLQQCGYLVAECSDANNFISKRSTLGDAIQISSPIGI